jgi:hypothetical protein
VLDRELAVVGLHADVLARRERPLEHVEHGLRRIAGGLRVVVVVEQLEARPEVAGERGLGVVRVVGVVRLGVTDLGCETAACCLVAEAESGKPSWYVIVTMSLPEIARTVPRAVKLVPSTSNSSWLFSPWSSSSKRKPSPSRRSGLIVRSNWAQAAAGNESAAASTKSRAGVTKRMRSPSFLCGAVRPPTEEL